MGLETQPLLPLFVDSKTLKNTGLCTLVNQPYEHCRHIVSVLIYGQNNPCRL